MRKIARSRTSVRRRAHVVVRLGAWIGLVAVSACAGDSCCRRKKQPPVATCPKIEALPSGPVVSVWEDGTVGMAIPVEAVGGRAQSIVLEKLAIAGGTTTSPTLPSAFGDLLPDQPRAVEATFAVSADGTPRSVTLSGTFQSNALACTFAIAAQSAPARTPPGPRATTPAVARKHGLTGEAWPAPPPPAVTREPNAESGTFIPPGPRRNFMTTPPAPSKLAALPAVNAPPFKPAEQGGAAGVNAAIFTRNGGGGAYGGWPPDPSVAATRNSGVVMISANTAVSWSRDWGSTFTLVNLTGIADRADPSRTTFFPAKDGGLCCDQVLTYSAKYDLFIWVHQTWPSPGNLGPNRLYVAWARPSAMTSDFLHAWQWIEVDSPLIGITGTDWIDYPDVTVSDQNVYLSVDHAVGSFVSSRVYSRWSLADIADPSKPNVGGSYLELGDSGIVKGHIARESPDAMYFAALSSQSLVRVYTWPDRSDQVSWADIPISSYTNSTGSTSPDGASWNGGPGFIQGAVLTTPSNLCLGSPPGCDPTPRRVMWIAFRAGSSTDGSRPQPYVRIERIDMGASKLEAEVDIWNAGFAFGGQPSLSGVCFFDKCDIAVAVTAGGNGSFPQFGVGFLYDWLIYTTTSSNGTQNGSYGDYFNIAPSQGPPINGRNGAGYSALGYSLRANTAGTSCAAGGCTTQLQYTQFGREGTLNPGPPPR